MALLAASLALWLALLAPLPPLGCLVLLAQRAVLVMLAALVLQVL